MNEEGRRNWEMKKAVKVEMEEALVKVRNRRGDERVDGERGGGGGGGGGK